MRHCYVVRVFTDGQTGGNALGVIPDSVDLTAEAMQAIAAELGFSETVFIEWPADGIPALRIFTPATELPFAGHPLVGTAWVLNSMGPGAERMSIAIGDVRARMEGEKCWIYPPAGDQPVEPVLASEAAQLGVNALKAWRAAMPMDFLIVELADTGSVDQAAPDLAAVKDSCEGLYAFARSEPIRSRFFAPALGIDEDPATGSAAVGLAAVLRSEGQNAGRLEILQGPPGALSRLSVSWDGIETQLGGIVVHDEVRLLDN